MDEVHNQPDPSERPRTREDCWRRLETLLDTVERRGLDGLTDDQLDELGKLYRATATHLAQARTFGGSQRRIDLLNGLVGRAHAAIYGRPPRASHRRGIGWWFVAFPVTFRKSWGYHLAAGLLLVLAAFYGYFGTASDPDWALEFLFPGDDRTPYAERQALLETLRSGRDGTVENNEHAAFAAQLWQNNTKVALLSFFLGFLAGVPTIVLEIRNGVMLGAYSYTFHSNGLAYEWWAWILPHGVTELLALILLAGGGLWIGRIVVSPGEQTRREALRAIRGDLARLVLFAFPMLLLAAILESFVRQSSLGDPARYAIAIVTAVLWASYLGFVGPRRRTIEKLARPTTRARRAVPLPTDEELFGFGLKRVPHARVEGPGSD